MYYVKIQNIECAYEHKTSKLNEEKKQRQQKKAFNREGKKKQIAMNWKISKNSGSLKIREMRMTDDYTCGKMAAQHEILFTPHINNNAIV